MQEGFGQLMHLVLKPLVVSKFDSNQMVVDLCKAVAAGRRNSYTIATNFYKITLACYNGGETTSRFISPYAKKRW